MSAAEAARGVVDIRRHGTRPQRVRRRYNRYLKGSSAPFFRLVRSYYQHSFRELFLNGTGPLEVHKAVLSVLAGSVFPHPVWALRWRLWFFYWLGTVNRYLQLAPRRDHFSLFGAEAAATAMGGEAAPALAEPQPPAR
jgi:hypothetical protein